VLKSQVESAIPKICKGAGLACNEMVITSIPELSFPIKAGGETWVANYNPLNGAVSARKQGEADPAELSFRRFPAATTHRTWVPSGGGVRWFWALIVDVMAAIMCFWGLSGMLMWWQIKSTRGIGAATVILGLLAAASLGCWYALCNAIMKFSETPVSRRLDPFDDAPIETRNSQDEVTEFWRCCLPRRFW